MAKQDRFDDQVPFERNRHVRSPRRDTRQPPSAHRQAGASRRGHISLQRAQAARSDRKPRDLAPESSKRVRDTSRSVSSGRSSQATSRLPKSKRAQAPSTRPSTRTTNRSRLAATNIRRTHDKAVKKSSLHSGRIIFTLVGVIALALLVWGGLFAAGHVYQSTNTQEEDTSQMFSPVACTQKNVMVTLAAQGDLAVGKGAQFVVTLRNSDSQHPCYLNGGWSNMNVHVTSGEEDIADTRDCEIGEEEKTLLINRSGEAKVTIPWEGGAGKGCVKPEDYSAQPGTYHAELEIKDPQINNVTTSFVLQ